MSFADPQYKSVIANSARTAAAAVVSFWIASMFRLPEAYWATITTIVVMQSTLGAALKISAERLVGTVLGALMGAALAIYFPVNVLIFGAGVFVLGLLCALLRLDNAFRFAAITLAVITLIARTSTVRQIALHRFVEVYPWHPGWPCAHLGVAGISNSGPGGY
jgi:uncharacterized membrane protein YccC